jgi:hypothetical protein
MDRNLLANAIAADVHLFFEVHNRKLDLENGDINC